MTTSSTPGLARFNTLAAAEAAAALHEVCASAAWCGSVLAHRPYDGTEALLLASDAAMAELSAQDLAEAMAGHPPIGRPEPGIRPPPANSGGWPVLPRSSGRRCSNSTWPTRNGSDTSS